MTVKEHYEKHLGNYYSWYAGDFMANMNAFLAFCIKNGISPNSSAYALDLGAGNGIQSLALAHQGFKVKAIDFCKQLLEELETRVANYSVQVIIDDFRFVKKYAEPPPELIICCGDTLPHLDSVTDIKIFIEDVYDILSEGGKILLTFRDYSSELLDTNRFIPVKSDSKRILTCFLEYTNDKIRVTDLLHELEEGMWVQKASSYYKTRITNDLTVEILKETRFKILLNNLEKGIITIIGQK
jgi:2-polyprenyl-3-methyl-5-hydroxy-6-metoxy-1,4-benzoquinol methylase